MTDPGQRYTERYTVCVEGSLLSPAKRTEMRTLYLDKAIANMFAIAAYPFVIRVSVLRRDGTVVAQMRSISKRRE